MAASNDRWRWLKRYRMLLIAYGLALGLGTHEFLLARDHPLGGAGACEASAASCFSIRASTVPASDSTFWSLHRRMLQVVEEIDPYEPNTDFLRGIQALADGDEAEFIRRFERALASNPKHNPLLLQYYAQSLLDRGSDWRVVNEAVNRWHENHPTSPERLVLQVGAGPTTSADSLALREALASIPWLSDAALESYVERGTPRWRLRLAFRPGTTADMREAVAAVTVLSIPPEQRPFYRVTCETLQDCSAERRGGG